eukprot:c19994_g1_i2.p1 GENE.c19994_g1_i2~~c19994_g1_i2.p1  ORF type:complete len:451 (+),score=79.46 c19994_g1_i2:506-1858(+)
MKDNVLASQGNVPLGTNGIPIKPTELKLIYEHWEKKRKSKGKALLRRFVDPPEMNDPDPKVAFRPRHKTFTRSRRRNDVTSFRKMKEIRSGLERLQMLLELIKRREKLKEQEITARHVVYEAKIEQLLSRIQQDMLNELGSESGMSQSSGRLKFQRKRANRRGAEEDEESRTGTRFSRTGRAISQSHLPESSSDSDMSDESITSTMPPPTPMHVAETVSVLETRSVPDDSDIQPSLTTHAPQNTFPFSRFISRKKRKQTSLRQHVSSTPYHMPEPKPLDPSALAARFGRGGRLYLNGHLLRPLDSPRLFTLTTPSPAQMPSRLTALTAISRPHIPTPREILDGDSEVTQNTAPPSVDSKPPAPVGVEEVKQTPRQDPTQVPFGSQSERIAPLKLDSDASEGGGEWKWSWLNESRTPPGRKFVRTQLRVARHAWALREAMVILTGHCDTSK